jgi:hypothetical protein
VDATALFDSLSQRGLAFGMSDVTHGEIHGVVGKGYEKGGKLSSAR